MTIADLFKELHDTAKERIKNPIIGAFICSFIVYNWRPIFILLFSEMSIEERIEFISNKWEVIFPIIIALGYTLLIPLIMIFMDYALMPMKRKRISNIYENKGFTTDQKIIYAEKEFLLKNAESGNQERQALLDQIDTLERSKTQMDESNNNIVSNLNEKMATLNRSFEENVKLKNKEINDLKATITVAMNTESLVRALVEITVHLDKEDLLLFQVVGSNLTNPSMEVKMIPNERKNILEKYALIQKDDDRTYFLTSLGQELYYVIKDLKIE